jgi:hypothetical protein
MGLTDTPQQVNITDIYPEGTPFNVTRAWVEGVVKTQYGDRTMGKVVAEPIGGGPGSAQEFSVWGSLCEQVQSVDESELPMTVSIVKDGKRFLFQAAETVELAPGEPTAPEQALGVAPGAGEGQSPTVGGPAATV